MILTNINARYCKVWCPPWGTIISLASSTVLFDLHPVGLCYFQGKGYGDKQENLGHHKEMDSALSLRPKIVMSETSLFLFLSFKSKVSLEE